jgi:hypothetical protein
MTANGFYLHLIDDSDDSDHAITSDECRLKSEMDDAAMRVSDIFGVADKLPDSLRAKLFMNAEAAIRLRDETRLFAEMPAVIARLRGWVLFGESALGAFDVIK